MITIDAQNRVLGRLATEIAIILMGKHKASFVPYKNTGEPVHIINAKYIKLTGNKKEEKLYYRHSNYLGHLKTKKAKELSCAEMLESAIWNMLPKNKLREERIKLLKIE